MAIDWNKLEQEVVKPKQSFGKLVAGNYKVKLNMAYTKAGENSKGNPMLTLNTKTTSGETGMGTFVNIYLPLTDDNANQAKDILRIGSMVGVTAVDFIGKSNMEIVEFVFSKLNDSVEFYVDVNEPEEFNGKTRYTAWGNTIAKFPKPKQTEKAKPAEDNPKWEIDIETKTTKKEDVASSFGI